MRVRLLSRDEHEEYYRWYNFYHREGFATMLGCDNIVAVDQDGVLGAAILLQPILGGNFCMFTFITRNPFCDREYSSKAVDFLIRNLSGISKKNGYSNYISLIGEEPAKARFRKNGVKESKSSLTLFFGGC